MPFLSALLQFPSSFNSPLTPSPSLSLPPRAPGLPKPPHFTSDPNGGEENSYTLTWETESYYPIESYRLKYRKAKVRDFMFFFGGE